MNRGYNIYLRSIVHAFNDTRIEYNIYIRCIAQYIYTYNDTYFEYGNL